MVKRYHTQKEGSTYAESDHTTTYGGKGTDDNKLDTLLAISILQKVGSRTEHNAKLKTNSVWGIRN